VIKFIDFSKGYPGPFLIRLTKLADQERAMPAATAAMRNDRYSKFEGG